MKGISPVIAVILLLLIVIAIIGFSFGFFQRLVASASTAGETQLGKTTGQAGTNIKIDNAGGLRVTIRNIGTENILNNQLSVYINNSATSGCDLDPVDAGKSSSCVALSPVCGNGATIKITSPGGSVSAICPV